MHSRRGVALPCPSMVMGLAPVTYQRLEIVSDRHVLNLGPLSAVCKWQDPKYNLYQHQFLRKQL